jgi:hypothetical protein
MINIIEETYTTYFEKIKINISNTKKVVIVEVISTTDGLKHNYENERKDYEEIIEEFSKKNNVNFEDTYILVDGDYISVETSIEKNKTQEEIEKEIEKTFNQNAYRILHITFNKLPLYKRNAYNHVIFNNFFKNKSPYEMFKDKEFEKITEYFSSIFVLK